MLIKVNQSIFENTLELFDACLNRIQSDAADRIRYPSGPPSYTTMQAALALVKVQREFRGMYERGIERSKEDGNATDLSA